MLLRLLPLIFALLSPLAHAQDVALVAPDPEQELATAIKAQVKGSEFITMQVDGKEVLGLFMKQTRGQAKGAVILLHDVNGHPDWPGLIKDLRRHLPAAGWHTLSIQLSHSSELALNVDKLDAANKRIAAALDELKSRSIMNNVLLGLGQGAHMAVDFINENLDPTIRGLIVANLDGSPNDEPRLDAAARLSPIEVPIYDVYAERAHPSVVSSAKRRYDLGRTRVEEDVPPRLSYQDIARKYTPREGLKLHYRQLQIGAANHQFTGATLILEKRLRGWLNRYAAGNEIRKTADK